MSNVAIIYMTKYGHTKQYADWLKEELGADVFSVGAFSPAQALAYKLVIFLSGVYGDKIQVMDYIKKNQTAFNLQRMMIGAVSWYTNESEEGKTKLIAENFPETYKNVVPLFVLNSGIDKKKINAMEKAQLLAAQMSISKHDGRSSDDINILAIIKGYSDQTSRDNLTPLKNAVEAYFKPKAEAAKPKAEPPKPAPAAPEAPKPAGGVVVSSLDDALATLNDGNAFAKNAAPTHYSASVEKPAEVKEEELATLSPAEEKPLEPAPAPVEAKKPEPPKDDLLASLDNAFANLGGAKHTEPAPAPVEEKKPEPPKDDLLASLDNAFANLGGAKHTEPAPAPVEEKKPEPPKDDLLASLDNAFANLGGAKHEEPAPAPVEEKKTEPPKDDLLASLDNAFANLGGAKHTEPAPAPVEEKKPEPPKDDLLASLDNAFANLGGAKHTEPAPAPVEEKKPELTPVEDKPAAEVKLKPVDDPHILKGEPTQKEKDNQSALDSLEAAFANLKKPEPKPHEVKPLRVPPIHKEEPAKEETPKAEPAPTIIPKAAAPKKNSYLELFSKRTKTEEALAAAERSAQQPAEEVKPQPAPASVEEKKPEPIKPAAPDPVAFDPFFDEAVAEPMNVPEPAYTAPLPAEPISSSIDDFDFDLMGNESSTASKTSKRVLTAVSDLAKAKAKAAEEAERAKESLNNDDDDEPEASDNTYSVADNQLTPSVSEEAPAERPVFEREQPQEEPDGRHHENTAEAAEEITKALREVEKYISAPHSEPEYDNEPEAPETEEFGADDVIFDNDADYEPDEEPEIEEVPSGGTFDFKKLQQEIEASIEVNKKIKEKERLRNTRELDRAKKEEEGAVPKKGITQPIDPDIFFQRPGKDYYDSDTMPEIRFDRHKRGK